MSTTMAYQTKHDHLKCLYLNARSVGFAGGEKADVCLNTDSWLWGDEEEPLASHFLTFIHRLRPTNKKGSGVAVVNCLMNKHFLHSSTWMYGSRQLVRISVSVCCTDPLLVPLSNPSKTFLSSWIARQPALDIYQSG